LPLVHALIAAEKNKDAEAEQWAHTKRNNISYAAARIYYDDARAAVEAALKEIEG